MLMWMHNSRLCALLWMQISIVWLYLLRSRGEELRYFFKWMTNATIRDWQVCLSLQCHHDTSKQLCSFAAKGMDETRTICLNTNVKQADSHWYESLYRLCLFASRRVDPFGACISSEAVTKWTINATRLLAMRIHALYPRLRPKHIWIRNNKIITPWTQIPHGWRTRIP